MSPREITRRERYAAKNAKYIPISIACVNFGQEQNLAFIIRSAACFGVENVYLIGSTQMPRHVLKAMSGSTLEYVNLIGFKNPNEFIEYARSNNEKIISLELPQDAGLEASSLSGYEFDLSRTNCIVAGHETSGVPNEILYASDDILYIPMNGHGYCLNTSQTANIALYEAQSQFFRRC